jgi:hypothetical protein
MIESLFLVGICCLVLYLLFVFFKVIILIGFVVLFFAILNNNNDTPVSNQSPTINTSTQSPVLLPTLMNEEQAFYFDCVELTERPDICKELLADRI